MIGTWRVCGTLRRLSQEPMAVWGGGSGQHRRGSESDASRKPNLLVETLLVVNQPRWIDFVSRYLSAYPSAASSVFFISHRVLVVGLCTLLSCQAVTRKPMRTRIFHAQSITVVFCWKRFQCIAFSFFTALVQRVDFSCSLIYRCAYCFARKSDVQSQKN